MKSTIKFYSVILTIIIGVMCSSCSKEDEYISPLKGKTIADLTFDYREDLKSLTIDGINLNSFQITTTNLWCIAGVIDGKLLVMVLENSKYESRESTVSVTDPEDGTKLEFKVYQKEKIAILVDESFFEVPEEGGVIKIDVKSNANYQVDIEDDWITLDQSATRRAMQSSVVVLSVSKNNSGNIREGIINLKDLETETTKKISVKQSLTPYITVDKESVSFDEYGGNFSVNVKTNIEIKAQVIEDGAQLEEMSSIDENTKRIKFKVFDMPKSIHNRTINIDILGTVWNNSCHIVVNQKTGIYITSTATPLLIGDTQTLKFINNWAGNITWSSSDESVLKVSQDAKVSAVGKGSATIFVSSGDGRYSDEITISTLNDLNSLLSYSWTKSTIQVGSWGETNDGCTLKNNSSYDIKLTKLSIYGDNILLGSTTDQNKLGLLPAGGEKNLGITNLSSGVRTLKFVWEYSVIGKSFSFECSHNL